MGFTTSKGGMAARTQANLETAGMALRNTQAMYGGVTMAIPKVPTLTAW